MDKPQKCSTKGDGQLPIHLAELICPSKRSRGGWCYSFGTHLLWCSLFYQTKMVFSFHCISLTLHMFITKLFISSCFALFPSLVILSSANRGSRCSLWLGGAPPAHPRISLAILCWNPSREAQMLKQKLAARRLTCTAPMFACLVAPAFSPQPACAQVFSLPRRPFGSVLAILLWVCVSASTRALGTPIGTPVFYEHNVNIVNSELL